MYFVFRNDYPSHSFCSEKRKECKTYVKDTIEGWSPCHVAVSDYPRFKIVFSPFAPENPWKKDLLKVLRKRAGKFKEAINKETALFLSNKGLSWSEIELMLGLRPRRGMNAWLLSKGDMPRFVGEWATRLSPSEKRVLHKK